MGGMWLMKCFLAKVSIIIIIPSRPLLKWKAQSSDLFNSYINTFFSSCSLKTHTCGQPKIHSIMCGKIKSIMSDRSRHLNVQFKFDWKAPWKRDSTSYSSPITALKYSIIWFLFWKLQTNSKLNTIYLFVCLFIPGKHLISAPQRQDLAHKA